MELIVSHFNHFDLIEISGRIDSFTAPEIHTALSTLLTGNHYNIIVDLQNVSFISSSGILTFVKIQQKLKLHNKGEIIFMQVPELVFKSFSIAGFDTVFTFYNDLETAMGGFGKML